jgi:hypothetical protein
MAKAEVLLDRAVRECSDVGEVGISEDTSLEYVLCLDKILEFIRKEVNVTVSVGGCKTFGGLKLALAARL